MQQAGKYIEKAALWLGVAALVVSPTQWAIRLPGDIHVAPADPLVWLALGCLGLSVLLSRRWELLRPPPLLLVGFVILALISGAGATSKGAALKEFIQYAEYFGAGFVVFRCLPELGLSVRRTVDFFLVAASAVIVIAAIQYFMPAESIADFHVRGTFGNHNVYGGFLALVLPLFYGLAVTEQNWARRAWYGIAVLAGLIGVLAGGTWVALLAGFGAISAVRGPRLFLGFAATAMILMVWVFPHLPRNNPDAWFESIAFYDTAGEPTERYPEWQAAAAMAIKNPWGGVGAGNYQNHINEYYQVDRIILNRPEASEPDSQNLYLVLAASLGFPALLFFAGALAWFTQRSGKLRNEKDEECASSIPGLGIGLLGAFSAFAVNGIWAPLLVRGIGLPLVFFMVLTVLPRKATVTHEHSG